ncbi:MAG: alpha/beta fold hydrolase [Aggregatilineales bacterium]
MKKLELAAQNVAYRESSGTDEPGFILIHGNSSSSRSFEKLLNGDIGNAHRVVALDLPGHGDSDPAPDPEAGYTMPGYARVIVEAAEALNMKNAIFVGWSLGGHIALEAVAHLPDAAGFVIFGTPPLAFPPAMDAAFLPNPNVGSAFNADLSDDEKRAFVESFFKPGTTAIPENFIDDINKTENQARAIMGGSIQPDGYTDEVDIVADMTQPLMIIHGAEEQLINGEYFASLTMSTLWQDAVQIIDDAGHAPHYETPDEFAARLLAFKADITG